MEGKIISCCGDCVYYDHKKHKCKNGYNDESNPKSHFYNDCQMFEDLEEYEEQIRADEREKVLEEFKEKMRNLNQLNCFVDYVADEIDLEELMYYASEEIAEQLKEQKNK